MNETSTPQQGPGEPTAEPGHAPTTGFTSGGQAGPPPPRSGADSFFDSIRRTGLFRTDERWIGGVGGGLAHRLGIDPLVVRGLLAASALLGGLGLVLYGLGWLLLPEQRDGRIHLQQLFHGDFDAAVLGGFALLVIGLSVPGGWAPGPWGNDSSWIPGLLWLGAITVVVVLIISSANKNRGDRPVRPVTGAGPTTTAYRTGPTTQPYPPTSPLAPYGGGQATAPLPYHPVQPGRAPMTGAPAGSRPPEGPRTTMYPTTSYPAPVPPTSPPGGGQPWSTATSDGGHQWSAQTPGPVTALPRGVRKGPGAGVVGTVVALSLLTLAGLLYAQRVGTFDGPVYLTAGAVAVVLLGVATIISGLRGRTSGGLGGLAVVSILFLLPAATISVDGWDGWDGDWDLGTSAGVGDIDHTPTDATEAEAGYSLGAGDATIDLTELPLGDGTITVPVHLGAGDLTIVMPQDGAFTADIQVMAGEVRWLDESVRSGVGGDRGPDSYESQAVSDGATPDIALDISVGAGSVNVEEER